MRPRDPVETPPTRSTFRRALAARRRSLPWSDRSILLFSLLIVLVLAPLWLDPVTLGEVAGRRSDSSALPSAADLATPRRGIDGSGAPLTDQALIARDVFARSVEEGWGSAVIGGTYSAAGQGRLSVADGTGISRVTSGDGGAVVLSAVAARDVVVEYTVGLDRRPASGDVVVYALLRAASVDRSYRVAVHFAASGTVFAGIEAIVDGRADPIDRFVVLPSAGDQLQPAMRVRVEAFGTDPTTVRLRAWPAGTTEPGAWHVSVIDWTGALQRPGAVGLGWQLDSLDAGEFALRYMDLSVWNTGE